MGRKGLRGLRCLCHPHCSSHHRHRRSRQASRQCSRYSHQCLRRRLFRKSSRLRHRRHGPRGLALLQLLLSSKLECGHNPYVRKIIMQCAGSPLVLPLGRSVAGGASLPDAIVYMYGGAELQGYCFAAEDIWT